MADLESVRCGKCRTVQFRGERLSCVKCRWPLPSRAEAVDAPATEVSAEAERLSSPTVIAVKVAGEVAIAWPLGEGEVLPTMAAMERELLAEAHRRCCGNVQGVARVLGIGKTTAYRKLAGLGLGI